jgi:hypothetical protein
MSQGRSLRLFLVDGTPNGLLTAEIMNWTGHVLTGPRSKLAELVQRPECARTGVYFLVGPDPDDSLRTRVYIGESDDVAHSYTNLPESDRADMAFFLEQIRIVLPVLGFDFLRELIKPSKLVMVPVEQPVSQSPRFALQLPKSKERAQAQEVDGEFFVLKGSRARAQWVGTADHNYRNLYQQLVSDGVMVCDGSEYLVFKDDYAFSSPSAAAAVVCGRAASGRTAWQVEGSGETYAAWQDSQLSGIGVKPESEWLDE